MNTTPTQQPEALRLAESLDELDAQFSLPGLCGDSAAELLSQNAEIARLTAENEALRAQLNAKFIGLQISVDVSTGDNDAGHRLFGTVTGTLDTDPLTLLCDDAKPNFSAAPPVAAEPQKPIRPLTRKRMNAVLKSVAESIDHPSIVMTHWPNVVRAIEAVHGIGEKT